MSDQKERGVPEPEFKVGDIIRTNKGNYENQKLLGIGGMGAVYQVTDPEFGSRRWALKTVLPGFGLSESNFERLEDEGKILSGIEHENVIRVEGVLYLANTEPRRPAILMELLEGCTLRNLFDTFGPDEFSVEDICQVAIGVCNALAYVHHRGIIHRDVKAENIFIEKKETKSRVVLLDFGIMRAVERVGAGLRKNKTERDFIGTFSNASPEQLLVQQITRRADIYSFGTVLYEMVARRTLFPHCTDGLAIGQAHIDDKPQHLRQLVPHVPNELLDIIMQALEKAVEARPKDAYALMAPFQTLANKLFFDAAKDVGNTTFRRLQTRAVAGDRWPVGADGTLAGDRRPIGANAKLGVDGKIGADGRGQTVRMAHVQLPPVAPPADTTAPSGPPLSGTTAPGGRRHAEPGPTKARAAEPALPVVLAGPKPSSAIASEPPRESSSTQPPRAAPSQTAPGGPHDARRRGARSGLSAAPVISVSGLPEGVGTDPTSSVDAGRRSRPPIVAREDGDLTVSAGLPLRGTRTLVLALVAALGVITATSVALVKRPWAAAEGALPATTAAPPAPLVSSAPVASAAPDAPPLAAKSDTVDPVPVPAASVSATAVPPVGQPIPTATAATASAPTTTKAPKPPTHPRAPAPRPSASVDKDQARFEDINVMGK